MEKSDVEYRTKTATEDDLYWHLKECSRYFEPPLDGIVEIEQYSKKLFEKSITFEAWRNQKLIGLISAYFNDPEHRSGFISNVSVLSTCTGKGIASELLSRCIQYSKGCRFEEILLEVSLQNSAAMKLYERFDFQYFMLKGNMKVMRLAVSKIAF